MYICLNPDGMMLRDFPSNLFGFGMIPSCNRSAGRSREIEVTSTNLGFVDGYATLCVGGLDLADPK